MRHFTSAALALACLAGAAGGQTVPERIGFQGRLTDASGNPVTGTVNLTFTLYDADSGGATVWTETQNNVPVSGGLYSILLGDSIGLGSTAFDKPYWLGVKAGDDAEMTPLYRLAASPYAIRARLANGLEGREARFLELSLNGSNYVGFRAPDAIGANHLWTLPATDGTSGQVLTTDGSGLLSWSTAGGGGGTVTSVGSGTGLAGGPITTSGSLSFDTAFGDGRYVTLSSDQTISGAKTFSNAANSFAGSGAGLTGVDADMLDGFHVADLDLRYIRVAGGTMGGRLTLAVDPVNALDATTKQYVDTGLAAKANVSPNADLSNLVVSGMTLAPTFSPITGFYVAEWYFRPVSATVTPTAADPAATITVNGETVVSGATSSAISVRTGITRISIVVTATDGVTRKGYMILIMDKTDVQQTYVKASNTGASDNFGFSIAVSGDTMVVGAYWEDSSATGVNGNQTDDSALQSGAAYVFVRSGGVWTQQAYLKASNTGADDQFGYSVAVSGDTVVVGAPYEASNATGVNGNQADNTATNSGAAYVFARSGGVWTQQAYLKASNTEAAYDYFGWSVAVSGDTVVVGALGESSNATGVNGNQADNSASMSGAAYMFVRSSGVWTQQAYLKASNTEAYDYFGCSVAVSGDTVVVGAPYEDSNATGVNGNQADNSAMNSGAAYVFVRSGGVWTQQVYLKASNTGAGDYFSYSVAVSGDTVVVGTPFEDSNATGVNGNQADNSASASGAAYMFARSGGVWTQQAYLKASNTGASDYFGYSVAVSGYTVVVGAPFEDSNATGINGNQADNSATESGAINIIE